MISRQLKITLIVLIVASLGMGFYAWQLKRRAEASQKIADLRPVEPPAGSQETISTWVASDADSALHLEQIQAAVAPQGPERSRAILRALVARYQQKDSPHAIAANADINAVYLLADGVAIVDLNSAFAEGHRSGIGVEQLTLFSFVQTLAANSTEVKRVHFLVNGQERETLAGHFSLAGYIDVAEVADLSRGGTQ